MAVGARETLGCGVRLAVELQGVPEQRRADAEGDAWEKLSAGTRAARTDAEVLEGHPDRDVQCALQFLAAYAGKRKVLKGKIRDCLKTLISHQGWRRAAQGSAELVASLQDIFADDPGMLAILQEPAPEPGLLHRVCLEYQKGDAAEARKNLLEGLEVMERFGWAFPPRNDGQDCDRDAATEGFQKVSDGVTRLDVILSRALAKEDCDRCLEEALSGFEPALAKAPGFLASMSREKRAFASKLKFVVSKLTSLSPDFEAAAQLQEFAFPSGSACAAVPDGTEKQAGSSAVNAPETASTPALLVIRGAGEAKANGIYKRVDEYNGGARYSKDDELFIRCGGEPRKFNGWWCLTTRREGSSRPERSGDGSLYDVEGDCLAVPLGDWGGGSRRNTALEPGPTVDEASTESGEEPRTRKIALKKLDSFFAGVSSPADAFEPGTQLQWMWANAGLLSQPVFTRLAEANPLRWSELREPHVIAGQLEKERDRSRPVRLRVAGGNDHLFGNPSEAVAWVRQRQKVPGQRSSG